MSAEFVDALKGYEYYLMERGDASIEDVNNYLVTHGRTPIQLRTYGHYHKLLAHGFRSYIPINKFDVFQSLGRIQMAADRRRYGRDKTKIPAKISLDRTNWKNALIVDKSLVGFGIDTSEIFSVSKGTKIWVKLDGYNDIPAILVWKSHNQEENKTELGVRAFEFIAKYKLNEEDASFSRLTGILQISREQEGILDWQHIYRVLDKTNELLDAVSDLIYSLDDLLDTKIKLARPILMSIKFGSPGQLQTKVDFGIAEILGVLIEKIQYWSLDRKRFIEENRKRELENVNYSFEVVRNAINFRKDALDAGMSEDAILTLLDPIKTIFNVKKLPKGLFDEGTLERAVLFQRVVPVVAELVAGDDPDFKIKTYRVKKHRGTTPLRQTRLPQHSKRRT